MLYVKALHVIAIISWMAGLLYLPRLFVYHTEVLGNSASDQAQSARFKIMEHRLSRYIMTPAMLVSWLSGLYLAADFGFKGGWLHGKLLFVLLLSAAHGVMIGHVKKFSKDENQKSGKYFRILNEVPTVLMILIVLLVIVKPF